MAEINNLSTTDASNTARFPEGMRVNAVNDSARALEGMIARGLKDVIDGSITSAGTTTAYTVASNRTLTAYYDGMTITVQWNATCGATPTVNVDSIGAKNLYWPGGAQVTTGDLLINARSIIQYDGTNFQVLTGSTIDTDAALATHIADTSTHGTTGAIVGTTDTQTLTGKTVVVASNTITTAASGNLTSTELNAALAELQTDVDTKTTLAAAQAATAADVVSTNADVVTTNADVVLTNADVVTTNADAATTTQDAIDTAADAVSTAADVVSSAASATTALAAAQGWGAVTTLTTGTTNVETANARTYYILDATGGTITVNMPAIGTSDGILFGFEVSNVDNAITIVRDGTDTINGVAGNYSGLISVGQVIHFIGDDTTTDNWLATIISQVGAASETASGSIELATQAETDAGTDDLRAVTPLKLATYSGLGSSAKNLIINGGFQVNQRVYVSTTATADGTYMHDRWRSGTANSSYTFSTASPCSPQTVTIAANDSIEQVIEGTMVLTAGTHTISWTGTATGRAVVNTQTMSGNFAVSPITVTAVKDQVITLQLTGANAAGGSTIATDTGTLSAVMCVLGTTAPSTFVSAGGSYGAELALCQRYYQKSFAQGTAPAQAAGAEGVEMMPATLAGAQADRFPSTRFATVMRAAPTVTLYNPTNANAEVYNENGAADCSASTISRLSDSQLWIYCTGNAGAAVGHQLTVHWQAVAEL